MDKFGGLSCKDFIEGTKRMNQILNKSIMAKLTLEEHKQRHIELHKVLDELFADYIEHHKNDTRFLDIPFKVLMDWSYTQTINPKEIEKL